MPKKKTIPKVVEEKDEVTEIESYVPETPVKRVDDIFNTLYAVDVRPYVFQKGGFDYISWATAIRLLLQHYPLSDWTVVKHKSEKINVDDKTVQNTYNPYFYDPEVQGYVVEVGVTVIADDGQLTRSETLPVINFRNQVIDKPDQMAVNKAIKRCLVKCIANMGLGLQLYEGDNADYTEADEKDESSVNIITEAKEVFEAKSVEAVNDSDCQYVKDFMMKKFPKSAKNRETFFKSVASTVLNHYKASTLASPDELTPEECTKIKQHLMKG